LSEVNYNWPFLDPPNTAVITTVPILNRQASVQYVTHDHEDGAWQFHHLRQHGEPASVKDAAVISLGNMLRLEPRIAELSDLPLGCHAWRDSEHAPWIRAPKEIG
jgi:hypothetical protein